MQKTPWTFLDKSTREYTHAIHLYPARMHPEIAKRIIDKYTKDKKDIILDPFVGSGSVLVEGILHGNQAIGIDINPLAVLLSKVKTTPIYKDLYPILTRILCNASRDYLVANYHSECLPDGIDIDNWYNQDTLKTLTTLKYHIFKIRDTHIRDFFKVCFSLTVRKSSYQRNGSWKIHRISDLDRMEFKPKPVEIFSKIAVNNINKINSMMRAMPKGKSHVIYGDSKDITINLGKINDDALKDKKVNLIVTSPPYGDHGTTVAYGQFSKHSSLWLDLPKEQALAVDKIGLGGKHTTDDDLGSATLNATLEKVRKNDIKLTKNKKPSRTQAVHSFFYDLDKCLEGISHNLKPHKSHCCFVVANRTVRRIVIPTDTIITELSKKYGFKTVKIIQRDIPNKVLPTRNAPENIHQKTGNTMTHESVMIMKY